MTGVFYAVSATEHVLEYFISNTARLADGSRKVIAISEVLPLKNGEYQTSDLIARRTDRISPEGKIKGKFILKNRPTFVEQAAIAQLRLPEYK